MLQRIKYTCLKCRWQDSIIELWSDIKPRKCPKCKISFRLKPELLKVEMPTKESETISKAIESDANEVFKK